MGTDCRGSLLKDFQRRIVGELENNLTPSKVAASPSKDRHQSCSATDDDGPDSDGGGLKKSSPLDRRRRSLRPNRTNSKDQSQENEQSSVMPTGGLSSSIKDEVVEETAVQRTASPANTLSRSSSKTDASAKKAKVGKGKGKLAKDQKSSQPFVETLGVDVPSMRSMLAFNSLNKRAHLLGSSVVREEDRRKRQQHRTESPLGTAGEDSIKMDQ